jgi:hypothetical protein
MTEHKMYTIDLDELADHLQHRKLARQAQEEGAQAVAFELGKSLEAANARIAAINEALDDADAPDATEAHALDSDPIIERIKLWRHVQREQCASLEEVRKFHTGAARKRGEYIVRLEAQLAKAHNAKRIAENNELAAAAELDAAQARIRELEAQLATMAMHREDEMAATAEIREKMDGVEHMLSAVRIERHLATKRAEKAERELAELERRIDEEMAFLSKDDAIATVVARAEKAEADAARLRGELERIANAKRRDFQNDKEFASWAQMRAHVALSPEARQAESEGKQ